jgi:hypothetical protein
MTEEKLLEFISRIIASKYENNVSFSLIELRNILKRDGVEEKYVMLVDNLIDTSKEATALGNEKKGRPVTMEELCSAIRTGRERIEREKYRC